jgi:hypothetical protein
MQEEDRSAFADIIQCDRGILDLNFDRFQSSHRSVWYSHHPSCQYVNGVPHLEQNVRITDADERYSVGESAVNANPSLAIVTSPRA